MMKSLFSAMLMLVGVCLISGCTMLSGIFGGGGGYDSYVEKEAKATYYLANIAPGGKAGDFAVADTITYTVVKVDGNNTIVEQEIDGMDYVLIYSVDTSVEMGKPNVTKAWVWKLDDEEVTESVEIEIMEAPAPTDPPAANDKYEVTEEDFSGMKIGSIDFAGKKSVLKEKGKSEIMSTTWTANNFFYTAVKTDAGGYGSELSDAGTGRAGKAKPAW